MDNKRWAALAGVLLLAGIVISAIFFKQRNEVRQHWHESRDHIADLERRNAELNESLENQKSRLSAEADLAEKKQAALTAVEIRITELKARLNEKQTELDTVRKHLQEADGETERLQEKLTSTKERIANLASERNQLENDKGILILELKEANRTITGLRDQLQEVISQVPELKDRLEQSLVKYQTVRENLTEAREQQAKLEAQKKEMRETYEALVAGLKKQIDSQQASIEEYREQLKVTFVDEILFGFSQVRISPEGKEALDQLARVLANVPEGRISIAGHADSIPVAPQFRHRFPSNWELSSARAAAVARHLLKKANLEPSRIEVIGLSHYQPADDNDTEAGRAKNRRVEIIITPEGYPD